MTLFKNTYSEYTRWRGQKQRICRREAHGLEDDGDEERDGVRWHSRRQKHQAEGPDKWVLQVREHLLPGKFVRDGVSAISLDTVQYHLQGQLLATVR